MEYSYICINTTHMTDGSTYKIMRIRDSKKLHVLYIKDGFYSKITIVLVMLDSKGRQAIRFLLEKEYNRQLKTQQYDTAK